MKHKVILERSLLRNDILAESKIFWRMIKVITSTETGSVLLLALQDFLNKNAADFRKYFSIITHPGKIEVWENRSEKDDEHRLCVVYFE